MELEGNDTEAVIAVLIKVAREVSVLGASTVGDEWYSASETLALTELARNAPLTQRELALRLRLEKSTVSRLLSGLEARGLVERRRDPVNRRWNQLHLSAEGRRAAGHLVEGYRDLHRHLLQSMTTTESKALLLGLEALMKALRQTTTTLVD